jgi:Predicted pyridoxal phosphate-dependent enzyme apparently involved in regulation of cell wall biogenesis
VRVPLLDLTREPAPVREAVEARVRAVFDTRQFILGRTVEEFEKAFCELTGCAHAVGMSSGTDAQLAILMAMDIGAGDAVLTTPYTFFATAGCIHRVGAEPVFLDIRPDTLHLDPVRVAEYLAGCRRADDGTPLTPRGNRIRAVIPVHLFGACCDMDALHKAVRPFEIPIIEDAAQAIGSWYPGASGAAHAGTLGHSAFFSFFPTKNLGAAGDAGLSVCASAEFADRLRLVRNHGMEQRYFHRIVGGNFRMDAIQAAVLHAKLPFVAEWNAARRRNAALYRSHLGDLGEVVLPAEPWKDSGLEGHHTYHQYVVRAQRRDDLIAHLTAAGIGHAIYYPVALHQQECFAHLQNPPCPEAERAARETVALPIFPGLGEDEIAAVAETIRAFYRS